jgi:hypothetical protein
MLSVRNASGVYGPGRWLKLAMSRLVPHVATGYDFSKSRPLAPDPVPGWWFELGRSRPVPHVAAGYNFSKSRPLCVAQRLSLTMVQVRQHGVRSFL